MSQLRADIEARIRERMRLWLADSFALYEMAGFEENEAYSDVVGELFRQLVGALTSANVDPDEVGQLMAQMLRKAQHRHGQRRAGRAGGRR